MRSLLHLTVGALLLAASSSCSREAPTSPPAAAAEEPQGDASARAIFQQRILPIFQAARPSSCTECHLSGVELKDYIRPSQEETFTALVAAGLVDEKSPERSKILQFIQRRPQQPSLVKEEVRRQEFEAFSAWLRAASQDRKLLAAREVVAPIGPQISVEVIRHARTDRVLASFLDNVWSEVGRCAACHSPDRNRKQVEKHGEQVSWIKLNDPPATFANLLDRGLIDPADPEKSLLLMKPTLQVEHGGGQKMVVGDRTYKRFRRFLDDYVAVMQGRYRSAEQLPQPAAEFSLGTEIWLKVIDVPARFDQQLLQADLYRWTDAGWSKHRVATSDRPVFGKGRLWQHSLSLIAPRGSQEAEDITTQKLPPGRYLVKLYVDQTGKLTKDFRAELSEDDLVGQVEVESDWPVGYGAMTVVRFPDRD